MKSQERTGGYDLEEKQPEEQAYLTQEDDGEIAEEILAEENE